MTFFNWLGMHDIQKFNPDFLFVRSLPKNKLSKKIHKTKGKNRSNLTGEEKTKKRSKDICY
jgi:hypothetical protein